MYNIKEIKVVNTTNEVNKLLGYGWKLLATSGNKKGAFAYCMGLPKSRI